MTEGKSRNHEFSLLRYIYTYKRHSEIILSVVYWVQHLLKERKSTLKHLLNCLYYNCYFSIRRNGVDTWSGLTSVMSRLKCFSRREWARSLHVWKTWFEPSRCLVGSALHVGFVTQRLNIGQKLVLYNQCVTFSCELASSETSLSEDHVHWWASSCNR